MKHRKRLFKFMVSITKAAVGLRTVGRECLKSHLSSCIMSKMEKTETGIRRQNAGETEALKDTSSERN